MKMSILLQQEKISTTEEIDRYYQEREEKIEYAKLSLWRKILKWLCWAFHHPHPRPPDSLGRGCFLFKYLFQPTEMSVFKGVSVFKTVAENAVESWVTEHNDTS